ncbi:hypothetical protein ACIRF8_15385 [Streptomyces sp. NPDC102406]|uniref:hypothetical protein n=1 Tax=Streptomyces sp. NPDC102406 TaxID=3366171 RepID=UPI0037F713B4
MGNIKTAWPENVIARHLTKAAEIIGDPELTVDVSVGERLIKAACRGCGRDHENERQYASVTVLPWATAHAEQCRALPKPEA